ncbi:CDP-glycerol glycerophosphotransferase family protein [Arthrobacter sp. ok362]|uniref:bifunctional glycosyltransferase/CDP-glycerol:glycerophosphate glycerophosphotransferase n=1 Tax=Arthrobacter sp. ok362 TaxID=1761745 RepID=UPI0011136B05|nr:CDP-glycerol glycerophosphotransferase family protein [Arthrobacter sp. ok362]
MEIPFSPEALTDVAVLETCIWLENGMLEVGGIAFIAGLPSDPGSLEVTLVLTDQAGKSRTISVARANNPDSGTTDKDPWGYYGAAGFSAEINVPELAEVFADVPRTGTLSTWNVAVDLTVAGGTRRVPIQRRTYGQFMRTLLSERLPGDIFVTPEFSPEDGFRLVLRRAAVVAEGVDISGRRIGLNLREIDPTWTFTKVVARRGELTAQAAVTTGPDGIGRAVLDLPVGPGQETDFPQWTLRAVTDTAVERGLGWGLTASSASCHVSAAGSPLVAASNAAGNLSLLDSEAFVLVESASLDQEETSLILVVKTGDPASASRVHLDGKSSVWPTSVQPTPHGGFEIVLPVPGPGNYRLECAPDAGTAGSASVVRVGHSLAGRSAFLGNNRVELQFAARTQQGLTLAVRPRSASSNPKHVPGLLSVVVPMHNADVYVRECLASVTGQSYRNIEVIVVDDGSTDISAQIVRDFRTRDPRIRIITQDRRGPGAARDRGVLSARGEFLTFVDSDDMVAEGGFARLMASLTTSNADFAVAGVQVFQGQKLMPVPWQESLKHSAFSRQTLPAAPVALRHMTVVGAAFRTSFWNAKALWFGASRAFESDRPMLEAYKAGTFDLLPDVVYRWRLWTQREKQADEQILVERMGGILPSWRATTKELAGHPEGLQEFESHFLTHVLLKNALLAVSHDFPALRQLAQENCREVLDGVNKQSWFGISLHDRIVLKLVAAGQFELLARFLEHNAPAFAFAPLEQTAEGVVYTAPLIEEIAPYLSEDTLVRPYSSLPAVSLLTSVHWAEDENRLLIEGAAYIEGLSADPESLRIGLQLVGPGGRVFPAKVERTVNPRMDQFAKDPHNSYAQACFVASIDFDDVIDDAELSARPGFLQTYDVRLILQSPETERICAMERRHDFRIMQTPISREHRDQIWITPEFTKTDGLRIRLRRSAIWATDVGFENRTLQISLQEYGSMLQFRYLRLTAAGHSVQSELVRYTQNGLYGSIEVPEGVWTEPSGLRHWTVDAVTADGRTRRIGWSLEGGSGAGREIVSADGSLRLTRTNQGNITLTDDPLWTEVVNVRFDSSSTSLVFDVRTDSPDALPAFELASDRHTFTGFTVKPLAKGLYELTFDLTVSDWGRQRKVPPSGRYYLRRVATTDGVSSYSSVTRAAQELGARGNRLDCSRVGVHLGASHTGTFRVTFQPALTTEEKSQRGQLALYERHIEDPVLPLDPEAFFFRCYFGEVANDSQVELHKEARRRWPQAKLYWEVSDFSVSLPEGGIPVVKRSEAWYEARSTATYTFSNNDADWWKLRRPGQTVVQTFHGHPFKRMGRSRWLSLGAGPERIAQRIEVKNDQWSHIVSQSPKATELYVEEYGFRGQVLELGYPRNDVFKGPHAAQTAADTRRLLGIDDSKTVVLYAPTWRESDQKATTETVVTDLFDAQKIAEDLGPDYVLLMRGHRYSAKAGPVDRGAARIIDVTSYPDSADLCLASDIGVFDYSSIRFDYAVTGKPMVFYVPDYSLYENERGWLFPYEESAPGPLVFEENKLAAWIKEHQLWRGDFSAQYSRFLENYAPYDDGSAAGRILDSVRPE